MQLLIVLDEKIEIKHLAHICGYHPPYTYVLTGCKLLLVQTFNVSRPSWVRKEFPRNIPGGGGLHEMSAYCKKLEWATAVWLRKH